MIHFNLQPTLENNTIILSPLQENDFEKLYQAASDPKIWEQHPNKDRWKKEVFKKFFEGALKSKSAFKIIDKVKGSIIGSTRFYDYNKEENSLLIGYTFYEINYWGKGINYAVKVMLLDYIFDFVSVVYFHIGAMNIRSQKAINKLGVTKTGEQEIAYYGEQTKLNYVYQLTKADWELHKRK